MPTYPEVRSSMLPAAGASVFDSPMIQAIRILAGLVGADDPSGTMMGTVGPLMAAKPALSPVAEAVMSMAGKAKEKAKAGIRAFHGSPHDFDKFLMEKIGTGEGAQAYGHGLYFADSKDTADAYRKTLSRLQVPPEVRDGRYRSMVQLNQDRVAKGLEPWKGGHGYEVNINADPDALLDWDAPLSQQSEQVRERISAMPRTASREPSPHDAYQTMGDDPAMRAAPGRLLKDIVGGESRLKQAGIPGIKYFDQGSRSAGQGTRNYVIWDDSLIELVKKYGLASPIVAEEIHRRRGDTQ